MKKSDNTEPFEILVNTHGTKPVPAATFGKGVTDTAGIEQAANAQKDAAPGQYER